jgi:hypothetical protein
MKPDSSRQFVQTVLDVLTPYIFKGNTVMLALEAVVACPDGFPKVLVDIANACPPGERAKLGFRSGQSLPMSRHAGVKERANSAAKKQAPVKHHPKRGQRGTTLLVSEAIAKAGEAGMTTRQISEALKLNTKQVNSAVTALRGGNCITRKPIVHVEQRGPQFRYFSTEKRAEA